jgi:hypothetical protein
MEELDLIRTQKQKAESLKEWVQRFVGPGFHVGCKAEPYQASSYWNAPPLTVMYTLDVWRITEPAHSGLQLEAFDPLDMIGDFTFFFFLHKYFENDRAFPA